MSYRLLKQAAEIIKPKIDWTAAQQPNEVGFVSPVDRERVFPGETKPLPAPTGPYKAPKPVKSRKTKQAPKQTSSVITPKPDTPETPLSMTPGYASLYNEELKNEEAPRYKSWPVSEGSPWHPGYSRVPNTVDPNNKNPKLHDEEAFQKIFGPRHSDWRQDNSAGWFNFSTKAKDGMFDEDAFWDDYTRHWSPYQSGPYLFYTPTSEPVNSDTLSGEASTNRNVLKTSRQAWDAFAKNNPGAFEKVRRDIIDSARKPIGWRDPNVSGPFTTINSAWDVDKLQPYDAVIRFPHQDDITLGYSDVLTPERIASLSHGMAPPDLYPPYTPITESTGAHEGAHNITYALSNDQRSGLATYPLGMRGIFSWHTELPTVALESTYNTDGKFVPEIIPGTYKPYRSEEDEYLHYIMPTADSTRVDMTGQIDPKSVGNDEYIREFKFPMYSEDLYNKGIRYWNRPHDNDRGAVSLDQLRFVPDHPVGWYYDQFGNKRLSGGELINYNDLYGDGKPKDMAQLSPNTRRFFKNLGQAPQAWIDAIDHPKEYAAAQDTVRRIMFPLLRKDISGMFRDGDVESIKLLRDYQHPAFQMMTDLVNGKNFFDLTDQERSDIMDKVEAIYPELRLDPVATPSWLVHAQKEFGLLPEMGVTGVRTLDQYNDIDRYDAYYRALDEYLNQYGNQGGGLYGI